MSIKVDAREFLFHPEPPEDLNHQDYKTGMSVTQSSTSVPWTHNYLHDLKSLWWVTVWMIFHNDFHTPEQLEEPPADFKEVEDQLLQVRILSHLLWNL